MPTTLTDFTIFRDLPEKSLLRLQALSRCRTFPVGSVLIAQGELHEFLYLVKSGQVQVEYAEEDNPEQDIGGTFGPGSILGLPGFLTGAVSPATVRALDEVRVISLHYPAIGLLGLQFPDTLPLLRRTFRPERLTIPEFLTTSGDQQGR